MRRIVRVRKKLCSWKRGRSEATIGIERSVSVT